MRKHWPILILAAVAALSLLAFTATFIVDEERDIILVETFGQVTGVYRGAQTPGLHFKWPYPFQKTVRYSSQRMTTEDPYSELYTNDGQAFLVSMYCTWQIADARTFNRAVRDMDEARSVLRGRLQHWKGEMFGKTELAELLTPERTGKLDEIRDQVQRELNAEMSAGYGIEVFQVGLKMWGLGEGPSQAAIKNQIAEQEKKAKQYRSIGEAHAQAIRAEGEAAASKIRAFAQRKAEAIRSKGYQAAAELYKRYEEHPELAEFIIQIQALRQQLGAKTVLWLEADDLPTLQLLRKGPTEFEVGGAASDDAAEAGGTADDADAPAGNAEVRE